MSKGGKETTYLVASKADDASQVALGHNSQPKGADVEALDFDPIPSNSRRPGGRNSIPSEQDWSDEVADVLAKNNANVSNSQQQQLSRANGSTSPSAMSSQRAKMIVAREDNDLHVEIDSTKQKPSTSSNHSSSNSRNNNNNISSSSPYTAIPTSNPPIVSIHPPILSSNGNDSPTTSPLFSNRPLNISTGSPQPMQNNLLSPPANYAQNSPNSNGSYPSSPQSQNTSLGGNVASSIVIPSNPGPAIVVNAGHFSMQGLRPEMEDRVTLLPHPEFNEVGSLPNNLTRSFFAVFDGHGGDVSAEYCRQHVHNNMYASEAFLQGKPAEGLRNALVKTEAEFCAACRRINLLTSSGTTAITAYIEADMLYVANIGDSRAVLCRSGRAVDASVDHKPGRKDEKARIEALGGRVGITEEDAFRARPRPCPCLWACVSAGRPLRVFPGGLSVSRTIGDISMKVTQLVSSEPEMWESKITPADEFLILACDGVWDVMNSQQAVDCVRGNLFRSNNDVEEASKQLANEAFRKGSTDNISVVVITLDQPSAAAAAAAAAAQANANNQQPTHSNSSHK